MVGRTGDERALNAKSWGIHTSQPIALRGRSVNWIARRSPKPQVWVQIPTVVLSQIIYIFPN